MRSRIRSTTSVIAAVAAASAASIAIGGGCSSPTCGPGSAPTTLIVSVGSGANLQYGNFSAGQNNDCPAPNAPSGVVSLTITGTQAGTGGVATFCVPRPDQLASSAQALGIGVEIIDLTGTAPDPAGGSGTCSYALDATGTPTGQATAIGLCGNGSDAGGFALDFTGSAPVTQTCATATTATATLNGEVAISL